MSNYNWSINLTQGVVAFLEGLLLSMSKDGAKHRVGKSATLAASIVIASALPSNVFGLTYNEGLWETVIATILGGAALTGIYDGGFIKNAVKAFIIDTSSMAITDEIYNSFILGGAGNVKQVFREVYPNPTFINKVTLG